MNRIKIKTFATSALVSLGLLGAGTMAAMADSHSSADDMAEIQAFQLSTQTLGQAITAAEAQTGGKAMSAEFEGEGTATPGFEVEVLMADGTTSHVMVNAMDGTVTMMAGDMGDQNGEDGDDDGDGAGEAAETTGN